MNNSMQSDKTNQTTKIFLLLLFFLLLCFTTKVSAETVSGSDVQPTKPIWIPVVTKQNVTLYTDYKPYTIKISKLLKSSTVSFKSEGKKIASVDKAGQITPRSAGSTKIQVSIKQKGKLYTYTINVTVKDPYFEIISNKEAAYVDASTVFEVKRYGFSSKVKWKLSKDSKAIAKLTTIDSTKCEINALKEGTITLTAYWGELSQTIEVILLNGKGELYVISEETLPYQSKYTNYSGYNQYTKAYYTLRSYLERLDIAGGGTLVVKPGTYTITNTLCIPSNTQIRLKDGVTIKKSYQTGTPSLVATRSLFQMVSYRSASKEGYYKKYNGEKNIQLIGEGNATIDMSSLDTAGIVMAHNSDILIQGISFINMNTNHFIELDASQNVIIQNNVFSGFSDSQTGIKEAINVDTPDKITKGFNQYWTSYDGTPNLNVTIQDNVFENLECAIGTHKYTENKRHKNMVITGNTFTNIKSSAIQMMNWDSPVITKNSFDTVGAEIENCPAITLKGVLNPTVTENTFLNLNSIAEAYPWKNKGNGSIYAITENKISKENVSSLSKNYISNVSRNFFMFYPYYNDFETDIEIYFIEESYNLTPDKPLEDIPDEPEIPEEIDEYFEDNLPTEDIIPDDAA